MLCMNTVQVMYSCLFINITFSPTNKIALALKAKISFYCRQDASQLDMGCWSNPKNGPEECESCSNTSRTPLQQLLESQKHSMETTGDEQCHTEEGGWTQPHNTGRRNIMDEVWDQGKTRNRDPQRNMRETEQQHNRNISIGKQDLTHTANDSTMTAQNIWLKYKLN